MGRFLWICLGGAAGTGARYLLAGWVQRASGGGFPWGTVAVNVLGSFLLAFLVQAVAPRVSPDLYLALTVGVLGGFTTYSTFNQDTLRLLGGGTPWLGLANLGLTVVACLFAGGLGLMAGRAVTGG